MTPSTNYPTYSKDSIEGIAEFLLENKDQWETDPEVVRVMLTVAGYEVRVLDAQDVPLTWGLLESRKRAEQVEEALADLLTEYTGADVYMTSAL